MKLFSLRAEPIRPGAHKDGNLQEKGLLFLKHFAIIDVIHIRSAVCIIHQN